MGPLPVGFGLVHIVPTLVCVEPLASGGRRKKEEGGVWSICIKLTGGSGLIRRALREKDLVQGESVWRARLPGAPRAVGPRELKTEGGL